MSLAARCIEAVATGVVAADLPAKARAHVERRASAKRRPVKPMHAAAFPKSSAHAELVRDWDDALAEERWRTIKAAVALRSGGTCELPGCTLPAVDPHHIISGPLKRKHEAVNTVVALCRRDHDRAQSNALPTLALLASWAEEHGYTKALGALHRRIDRIMEAQKAAERFADARAAQRGTKP